MQSHVKTFLSVKHFYTFALTFFYYFFSVDIQIILNGKTFF